jgi:hypothetical protein
VAEVNRKQAALLYSFDGSPRTRSPFWLTSRRFLRRVSLGSSFSPDSILHIHATQIDFCSKTSSVRFSQYVQRFSGHALIVAMRKARHKSGNFTGMDQI